MLIINCIWCQASAHAHLSVTHRVRWIAALMRAIVLTLLGVCEVSSPPEEMVRKEAENNLMSKYDASETVQWSLLILLHVFIVSKVVFLSV